MVKKKYSIKEEINWKITEINFIILGLILLFFLPILFPKFFPDIAQKYLSSSYIYTSFFFQANVALRLAGRYSVSEKNEKGKQIGFSSFISFVIYLSIFWFASYLIQDILVASNSLEFYSKAAIQNLNYFQYQFLLKNLDVELLKDLIEQISILIICNFGFLLFGIFKLNKKKENLIKKRKYRKVIEENENIKIQKESIDKNKDLNNVKNMPYASEEDVNNLKMKNKTVTSNILSLENKFREENDEFHRLYNQFSVGDSISEEIIKKGENAIMYASEMISLEPNINELYFARGALYNALNEWSKALKDFSYFLELNNSKEVCSDLYPEIYILRANCNFELSQYQECINDCLLAKSEEKNEQTSYWKAECFFRLENYVSAIKEFSKLIKLDPNNTTYLNFRAKSYLKVENAKKAIKDFEKCLQTNPKDKTLIEDLIQSYRLINDFDGVLIYLNKLIRMDNTNIEALLFKAAIYSNNEEYTKSNLLYSKIIKLDPSQDEAHEGKGWCFYNLGKYEKAVTYFSDAIKINKKNDNAYSGRGLSFIEIGNKIKAKSDFSSAIKLNPNNIDANNFFEKG